MIKLSSNIIQRLFINRQSRILFNNNLAYFAKQAPPKKGGKQQKKAQVPVQVQQPTQKLLPYQKLLNYFKPLQPGLSPSETEYLNNNFTDISQNQKQMLDQLADKIVELNTSTFYNFALKRQGLGTTSAYIVGSGTFNDNDINQAINELRKDI